MSEVKKNGQKQKKPVPILKPGDPLPQEYKDLFQLGKYTDEMIANEEKAMVRTFQDIFDEDGVIKVYVPELNCNITYRPLKVTDLLKLEKIENATERGDEMLYMYWNGGDGSITRDKFNKLTAVKKNAVLLAIMRKTPFLPPTSPVDSSVKGSGET